MSNGSLLLEEKVLNAVKRMRCSHRSGVIFLAMITAIAWPTALTIRHSRFATLTLAKLVASLALHPPVSATEADYAPHHRLRRSLSSRRSLWVAVLSYMCKKLSFPHPSRCGSTPSTVWEKAFMVVRYARSLASLTNYRYPPSLIIAPNHRPVAR